MDELLSCVGHGWRSDGGEQTTKDTISSLGEKQRHVVLWFCLISSRSPLTAKERVGENNKLLSWDKQHIISPGSKWANQDATAVFSHTISALDCSHYIHRFTVAWKE